jgi:hypothetical protein
MVKRVAREEGFLSAYRYDPENVITVVFDADTGWNRTFYRLSPPISGMLRSPASSPRSGCTTPIETTDALATPRVRDLGQVFCRAKDRLGSATLGGNGQCVRFSALSDLGSEPWHAFSLTEDLDLSLRLLKKGWRIRFCSSVAVFQEAVPRLRALVRQRSRWLQGHVVCWQHLPALLRSRLPFLARGELLLFLLLPRCSCLWG